MHRRILALEAKRAGQIQDSTKANSEERFLDSVLSPTILLPTEYRRCTGVFLKIYAPRDPTDIRRRYTDVYAT
jgi:hypothetical protein